MIAIGSDHGGYKLKEEIKRYLEEKDIQYKDFGVYNEERADYPVIAKQVAKAVQNNECEKAILLCRSGAGMAIAANKFKNIRCVDCYNEETARHAKMHNDANVITIGQDYVPVNQAICIIREWLGAEFLGGRHKERIEMLNEIEKENMK